MLQKHLICQRLLASPASIPLMADRCFYSGLPRLLPAIEGYSMGSKGKVFNLAEHTGMFKYMLSSSGHKYTTVAPTTVKKFATDSGRSDKFAMMTFFNKEHGRDLISLSHAKTVASPYSDIVDSYFIAKWCCVNANEIPVG